MQLEDKAYEDWVDWAKKETAALKQLAQGAAGGATSVEGAEDPENDAGGRVEEVEQDAAGAEVEGRRAPDTGGRGKAIPLQPYTLKPLTLLGCISLLFAFLSSPTYNSLFQNFRKSKMHSWR